MEKSEREDKNERGIKDKEAQGGYKADVGVGGGGFRVVITPIQGDIWWGGGGKREREKKNERERKDREAQRESNGFTLELFKLNIST